MYVCMYVFMCVWCRTYVRLCMYVFMCVFMCAYVCMCSYICMFVRACIHVCLCVCTYPSLYLKGGMHVIIDHIRHPKKINYRFISLGGMQVS
jgi:hypothetical protein